MTSITRAVSPAIEKARGGPHVSSLAGETVATLTSAGDVESIDPRTGVAQIVIAPPVIQGGCCDISGLADELAKLELIEQSLVLAIVKSHTKGKDLDKKIAGVGDAISESIDALILAQKAIDENNARAAQLFKTADAAIDENKARADQLFETANAATDELRQINVLQAESAALDAFITTMRSHVNLKAAMIAAAVAAAGVTFTQTEVLESNKAIASVQVTGLAKIGDVAAAFTDFRIAQVSQNEATAGEISALETIAGNNSALIEEVSAALSNETISAASRSDLVAVTFGAATDQKDVTSFLSAIEADRSGKRIAISAAKALAGVSETQAAVVAATEAIASVQLTLGAAIAGNTASISDFKVVQATVNEAVAEELNVLQVGTAANAAAVISEGAARSTQDMALAGRIDTVAAASGAGVDAKDVDSFLAAIVTHQGVRGAAIGAAQALAGVQETQVALTNTKQALASATFTLGAQIGANFAAFLDQVAVQATLNDAVAARLTTLDASVGTNEAALTSEGVTRATADSAISSRIDTTAAATGAGLDGRDVDHFLAAIAANQGVKTATLKSAQALAGVQETQVALTKTNMALASATFTLGAQVGTNFAAFLDQIAVQATQNEAVAAHLSTLDASVGTNEAAITSEGATRATAVSALATSVISLSATVGANYSAFTDQVAAQATTNDAFAAHLTSLDSSVGTNAASISEESVTRETAVDALAATLTTVSASAGRQRVFFQATAPAGNTDAVWFDNGNKAYKWNGSAWVAAQDGDIATNAAAIVSESAARASETGALAASITSLSTTIDGHSSTLTAYGSSIDGLEVKYGIVGRINGTTGGFVFEGILKNDGSVSYNLEINANVTIHGDVVIDGTVTGGKLLDSTITNPKLGANSVSHNGMVKGAGSQSVTVTLRASSRVSLLATYEGGDASSGFSTAGQLQIKIGSTVIDSQTVYATLEYLDPDTGAHYTNVSATLLSLYSPSSAGDVTFTVATDFTTSKQLALLVTELAA
jgi:hypothetical protein